MKSPRFVIVPQKYYFNAVCMVMDNMSQTIDAQQH